jgi:hypothetical protein
VWYSDPAGVRRQLPVVRAGHGLAKGSGVFLSAGSYRFQAVITKQGREIARDTATVTVEPSLYREESLLSTDEAALRRIAADSGGKTIAAAAFSPEDLARSVQPAKKNNSRQAASPGDSPWLIAAVIGILIAEWLFRRLKGLP